MKSSEDQHSDSDKGADYKLVPSKLTWTKTAITLNKS